MYNKINIKISMCIPWCIFCYINNDYCCIIYLCAQPNSMVASEFRHTLRTKSANSSYHNSAVNSVKVKATKSTSSTRPLTSHQRIQTNKSIFNGISNVNVQSMTLSDRLDNSPYLPSINITPAEQHPNNLHILNAK